MSARTATSSDSFGGRLYCTAYGLLIATSLIASPLSAQSHAATDSSAGPDTIAAGPDYAAYQRMLSKFLSVTSERGAPLETRFDYTALRESADATQRFMRIRDELFRVSPKRLSPPERLAWAINSYNFLVIQLLTENLLDRPTKALTQGKEYWYQERFESVRQIKFEGAGFFDHPVVEVDGTAYSLNQFERTFVFGGFEPGPGKSPPPGLDPRAHFALVCGAAGCPPLLPRAYRPDSIEAVLEFAVRNALSSPRHLRWNDRTGLPEGSTLFDWYAHDFGGAEEVLDFVKRRCPETMRARFDAKQARWLGAFIIWDWSLNHTPAPK